MRSHHGLLEVVEADCGGVQGEGFEFVVEEEGDEVRFLSQGDGDELEKGDELVYEVGQFGWVEIEGDDLVHQGVGEQVDWC